MERENEEKGESQVKATEFLEKILERDRFKRQLAKKNKELFVLETALYDSMEAEAVDKISIQGIEFKPDIERKFKLLGYHEKMSWDSVKEWFAWLKEVGEEGLIKIKETVHWKTRESFLKEWVDNKKALPKFIEEAFANRIKYNKSAIERMSNAE